MTQIATALRSFLLAEDGAVAVDYTTLTALGAGAALATTGVLWGGLESLVDAVNAESTGVPDDAVPGITFEEGFENGADSGWTGGSASSVTGIGGSVLGPIGGGDLVEREFTLEEGISHTAIQFDLYALDDLVGASGIIYAQNTEIGRVRQTESGLAFESAGVVDVDISAELLSDGENIGGGTAADSHARVTIRYDAPDPNFTFGFGSDGPSDTSRGSFALDDFNMLGLEDPNG